jgi:hypothetical protein
MNLEKAIETITNIDKAFDDVRRRNETTMNAVRERIGLPLKLRADDKAFLKGGLDNLVDTIQYLKTQEATTPGPELSIERIYRETARQTFRDMESYAHRAAVDVPTYPTTNKYWSQVSKERRRRQP